MLVPLILSLIIFSCYFLVLVFYFAGLLSMGQAERGGSVPCTELTVVVPFRNELLHLHGIID